MTNSVPASAAAAQLPSDRTIGQIKPVFEFHDRPRPTNSLAGHALCCGERLSLLHRQSAPSAGPFHEGKDLRKKPHTLFRVKIDADPVLLK
jgi:hypothetical protein